MYLPHELIIQILLRLPVKSLIRFKSVCKSWFSLISHPNFANSHFQLNSAQQKTHRIAFVNSDPQIQFRSIDLESSLQDDTPFTSLIKPNFESYHNLEIIGSCRGFILLYTSSNYYIWNPSTGVHKQIPLSIIESNSNVYDYDDFYGFGYDQLRDDYLVVILSYEENSNHISHLEFFSLRDNDWKSIEFTHLPYINTVDDDETRTGSLFNGAIHWLSYRYDLQMDVILAFDLVERKVLDMNLPDDFYHQTTGCSLRVFGEFLGLWAMDYDNDTVEIWVMKEYKVHSSWTKVLVLPIDGIPNQSFSPICSTKCGDIVGTNGGTELVKYNDKGELLKYRSYCNDPCGYRVVMYTESLLSLPGDNVQA